VDLFVRTVGFLYLYWVMTLLQTMGKIGTDAVKELRLQKLRNGLPFVINSIDLEPNQFYYEFPDGVIQLACLKEEAKEFTLLRKLSAAEEQALRVKYGFFRL
jgi:hypothetical protein